MFNGIMKSSLGLFFLAGILFTTTKSENLECIESEKCNCSKLDTELHYECSSDNFTTNLDIILSENKLKIRCSEQILQFPGKNVFPNINATNIAEITITFCPLAQNSLSDLEILQTEHLVSLNLENNDLGILNKKSFGELNIRHLYLNNNNITRIEEDAFEKFPNLAFVDLGSNDLYLIPSNIFKHNTELRYVNLRNNANLELQDSVFANLPNLQRLDIDNCSLKNLPPNTFKGSVNLFEISLKNNEIEELPESVFENLIELISLHLDGNRIKSIGKNVFSSLVKLQFLNLNANEIQEINENTFRGLHNLRMLKLNNNKIERISLHAFVELKQLIYLDLSYNRFNLNYDEKDSSPFQYCQQLDILLLSHNEINQFPENIVNNNENLAAIDLSYNKIENINVVSSIKKSPYAVRISVNNNKVSTVNFLEIIEYLRLNAVNKTSESIPPAVLYLGNNPIRCDCSVFDLVRYLNSELDYLSIKSVVEIDVEDLRCASPKSLVNTLIGELKSEQVVCPNHEEILTK